MRYDILAGLRRLYDEVRDESIPPLAEVLMGTETDPKYRKKYATLWRNRRPA